MKFTPGQGFKNRSLLYLFDLMDITKQTSELDDHEQMRLERSDLQRVNQPNQELNGSALQGWQR
jgi:hypothetical protein